MSVIDLERTAPAAPAPPPPANVLLTALRVALLVVLAVAAVLALPSTRPSPSTPAHFLEDLKAGRVSSVRYVSSSVEVRWAEGRFNWYRADLQPPLPALPPSANGSDTSDSQYGTSQTWVEQALQATGRTRIDYDIINGQDRLSWAAQLPWHDLSAAAGGAALAGFLLMLINGGGRFGNRWAWFWLMALTNGLGLVLYLVLEPSPVWQRQARQRPLPVRPVFLGGAGLLIAIVIKPAISVLFMLVSGS